LPFAIGPPPRRLDEQHTPFVRDEWKLDASLAAGSGVNGRGKDGGGIGGGSDRASASGVRGGGGAAAAAHAPASAASPAASPSSLPPTAAVHHWRRSLHQKQQQQAGRAYPNTAPAACPGPLTPGGTVRIRQACELRAASLPKQLPVPGGALSGAPYDKYVEGDALPTVLLPADPRLRPSITVEPGATLALSRLLLRSADYAGVDNLPSLVTPSYVRLLPGAGLSVDNAGSFTEEPAGDMAPVLRRVLASPGLQADLDAWRYIYYTVRVRVRVGCSVCGVVVALSCVCVQGGG
jgi:hypothetical protein